MNELTSIVLLQLFYLNFLNYFQYFNYFNDFAYFQLPLLKMKSLQINSLQITSPQITSLATCSQIVHFTLNLQTSIYKSYIKPGDKPLYVNAGSNHPPAILKNIPISVNKRLSNNSANQEVFEFFGRHT